LEQPDGGVVRANYGQVIPHRSESDEGIQSNVMMERVMKEVEGAPSSPSPSKAPTDPPPSTGMAKKVPPSPAAKLPFYQGAERLNAQGNELMQKKQFNQALELYTAALKISPAGPNSHVYYSNRAAAKLSLGDAESSIQDSISALTIRPDYVKAHTRLGLAHFASGRYDEAVANYKTALDLEPENEWVKSQYEKARKMLVMNEEEEDKVLTATKDKEDDGWPSPFVNKEEEAKDIIRQADEYKDNGNVYMKKKKYEEALHQYNLAIDTSANGPNSHIYYSNRAAAYCYLGQYSEAAKDCLASIELDDSYEKAYARYGLSLFFLGDYEGSINAYKKSLDLAPDNKASLSYLAKAEARLAEQQENEMQEEMAKKLNLGKMQETLGVGNDELDQEHYEGIAALHTELSQSRDDEGEGVVGQTVKAMDPFDTDEGDEI
jgi:tetratricopeptide (TPR) repeat protein